ncbi:MAG: hypothetical protein RLY78_4380 [Pseudomonadota bacterium]|jgi:hypothetical protein
MNHHTAELAAAAAQLVVDEGLEYAAAKRKAQRQLGRQGARHGELPPNEQVEEAVRELLALFHADTQPAELLALRELAVRWMERLQEFRPHLAGAVWRGTATRLSALHIELYCDDPKSAEIALINRGVDFDVGQRPHPRGGPEPVDVLTMSVRCTTLGEHIPLHLSVLDLDDLRGALKPDVRGRTWRGDLAALHRLLQDTPDSADA